MPFTISHIAAVLPLPRKRLCLSAMILGSMAPDFPYFVLLTNVSSFGHTVPGLFLVSLPSGLLALLLFQYVLKKPLLSLLPDSIQLRIRDNEPFRILPWPRFGWLVFSVLIGAATHLVLDAFTHADGFLVENWPLLSGSIPFWPYKRVYSSLQVICSIAGLAIIAFAFLCWFRNTHPRNRATVPPVASNGRRTAFLVTGLILAALFGLFYGCATIGPRWRFWYFVAKVLIGFMAAAFAQTLAFCIWWNLRKNKAPVWQMSSGAQSGASDD